MNNRYSVFKFFFASIACCLFAAALITGCGGSNNPSGPSGGSSTTSSVVPTVATGTADLVGLLINSSTNNILNDTNTVVTVTATLFGTSISRPVTAVTNNNGFAIYGLTPGRYTITAVDSAKRYETTTIIKTLTSGTTDLSLAMVPVPALIPSSSLNFYGRVLEATSGNPVMFSTILVKNSTSGISFETSTLYDGSFSLIGLSSGTYDIAFTMKSFETASRTLIIDESRIRLGTQEITTTGTFVDGSNVSRTGYNLGVVTMAPSWIDTGAIAGILLNSLVNPKTPYSNTKFDLVYDSNPKDQIAPASIIKNFTTNDLGYFFAENLPAGWYLVAFPGYALTPIFDSTGNTVGYNFGAGQLVFDIWLEVKSGTVTPIPQEK